MPDNRFAPRAQRPGPISVWTKLFQGLGTIPDAIKDFAFRTFLLLYYNQVLGLPASEASLALLVALIIDAVSDPVVGSYSDNLQHRWGRRHPLMAAAALPLAVCIYLLFAPPALAQQHLFWWLLVFAVGTRFTLTFFAVPWNALFAEMSDDYRERSELISYRFAVLWLISPFFTYSVFAFIFTADEQFPLGQLNPGHYTTFAWVLAAVVGSGAFLTTLLTWDQIAYLKHPIKAPPRFSFAVIAKDIRDALANREFRILFFAVLANAVVTGTSQALQIYMNTYFWGFGGEQLRWMAFSVAGGLLAFFTVIPLQNLFDKKYLLVGSSISIVLVSMVPVTLKLLDLAPPLGSNGLVLLVLAATTAVVYFITIAIIMFASMVADTLDLQELRTGNRQEGLFNSVITFSSKATSGIGLLMAGLLIDFVILLPERAQAADVTQDMTFRLAVLDAYVVPLFNVVWMALALRYGITRERHVEIRQALESQRDHTSTTNQLSG